MNPSAASSSKNKSLQKKLKEQKRKVGGVMKWLTVCNKWAAFCFASSYAWLLDLVAHFMQPALPLVSQCWLPICISRTLFWFRYFHYQNYDEHKLRWYYHTATSPGPEPQQPKESDRESGYTSGSTLSEFEELRAHPSGVCSKSRRGLASSSNCVWFNGTEKTTSSFSAWGESGAWTHPPTRQK